MSRIIFFMVWAAYWPHGGADSKNATREGLLLPSAFRTRMRAVGDTSKLQSVMLSCQPTPALRHLIRYYYQVETRLAGRTAVQPVPARSPQAIEFTFGTPYEVRRLDRGETRSAYPIALIGSQTFRRVELLMHGNIDAFTIVFQPGGVSTVFSVPAEELTNEDFEGEAVLGRGLGELLRRLGDVSSFADRARVADAYLCAKRPALNSISGITNAATRVLSSSGCVRVSDIAHHAGLGTRQFERRFRSEIGIPPKLYARIVRFEAALRRKAMSPETRWTDIAHALGYHDQMHMVHDFNRLSGDSPTAIGSRLDMFVQPEVVSAARPG
jgi:AraC-like DNA-binding protein